MQRKTLRALALAAGLASLGIGQTASAALTPYIWTGANGNDATDVGNWNPGLPNYNDSSGTGTSLVFDSTASVTNSSPNFPSAIVGGDVNGNADIVQVLFSAGAPAEFISGTGYLHMSNGAAESIVNNSTVTQTFNIADVAGYSSTSIAGAAVDAANGDIVINGTFHPGTDTASRNSSIGGAHDVYLSQIKGASTNQIAYTGSGHLYLGDSNGGGGNTYNGLITISSTTGGAIRASNSNSLGSTTSGLVITGGSTGNGALELTGGITLADAMTLTPRTGAAASAPHLVNISGSNKITANFATIGGNNGANVNIESRGTAGSDFLEVDGNLSHPSGPGTVPILNLSGAGNGLYAGNIIASSGNIDVVKSGGGIWTLSGTGNNVDGNYTVHGGTLVLAAGSAQHAAHYTVDAGAKLVADATNVAEDVSYTINGTLGGVGTTHGTTTISGTGTLAPGDSPGTLTVGNLTLTGATMAYELDSADHTIGSAINDLTVATGAVDITGGATLNVTPQNGSALSVGSYDLIDFTPGQLTGVASNIALGSVPVVAGGTASIQIDTDSVNLVVAVPEPSTLGLAGLGLVGFIRRRRK